MAERSTAEIIAFPSKPQDRLQRALTALDDALVDQRAAMITWRAEIAALQGAISDLGESLQDYRASLDGLAIRAGALGSQSRRLVAWADDALV